MPYSVNAIILAVVISLLYRTLAIKFEVGPCFLQFLEPCTEEVIQFYLFSSQRPKAAPTMLSLQQPQLPDWINLADGHTKLIVHGYGGNLDFYATKAIRDGEYRSINGSI